MPYVTFLTILTGVPEICTLTEVRIFFSVSERYIIKAFNFEGLMVSLLALHQSFKFSNSLLILF